MFFATTAQHSHHAFVSNDSGLPNCRNTFLSTRLHRRVTCSHPSAHIWKGDVTSWRSQKLALNEFTVTKHLIQFSSSVRVQTANPSVRVEAMRTQPADSEHCWAGRRDRKIQQLTKYNHDFRINLIRISWTIKLFFSTTNYLCCLIRSRKNYVYISFLCKISEYWDGAPSRASVRLAEKWGNGLSALNQTKDAFDDLTWPYSEQDLDVLGWTLAWGPPL